MIDLSFSGDILTSIVSTTNWAVEYFLPNGDLFVDLQFGPGVYDAIEFPLTHLSSTIGTFGSYIHTALPDFTPAAALTNFYAFTDPPSIGATAAPEASTWVMLIIGMASLAYASFRRRVGRLA